MKSFSLLALVVFATALLGAPVRAEDEFDPIPAQLTDRAVVMKLPEGVRRVRLRVRNDDGSWKTHTIAHLQGNEGYLKLRLPDGVAEKDLEITASWTDPFPYSFYQGATDHDGTESDGGFAASPLGPQFRDGDALEDADDEEPVVEQSDIWKWRGSTLYFFNQYRGLQVIDVSDPAAPDRLASLRVNAYGEQMYLHPEADAVILLTYDSSTGNGKVVLVGHEATHVLQQRATFPVPGYILESRLVGNILYVVSRNSWQEVFRDPEDVEHVSWRSGLAVTKIDLSDPDDPVADPPLTLSNDRYNYWGAQVQATSRALLVSTNAYDSGRRQTISTLHVIDISDPASPPAVTHHIPVKGHVLNKFNMNLDGDILTVVSQVWRWAVDDRRRFASVETFDLSKSSPRLAGIEFANNESITATRFVGDLLYVVTFLRIDPLFVIDLADPVRPELLSELEIPGFSTYLEPLGEDALISIGVEGSQIAVSWFDVSDPTDTSLASRVFIGEEDGWSWTEANWDENAFGSFPAEKLLLIPFQGSVPGEGWMSGVQLVELGEKELIKRGSFEHEFRARRAKVLGDAVVSISGRALKSLDITDRDNPKLLAELTLAWPADLVHRVGDFFIQLERGPGYWWYGTPASPARLHVSPVDDPDELLTSLDLPSGRVVGSFLHDDYCLFVAQAQTISEQADDHTRYSESFTTTVIDLAAPDQPVLAGSASRKNSGEGRRFGFNSEYRGELLPDGSLVWYPAEQDFFFFEPWPLDFAGDVAIPFFPSSSRVYTVDIADKSQPAILASADLATMEGTWPEGELQLVGDTLYHGLQRTEMIERLEQRTKWISRHFLGRLDLSDPSAPVARDFVNLPGTFEHALSTGSPTEGVVLFTTSQRHFQVEPDNSWRSEFRVQALAFDLDDSMAYLIEELVVPDWGYGPRVFHDRFLVLGKSDYSEGKVRTDLTIYEWLSSGDNGSFREVRKLERPNSIHRLGVRDHLLVALGSELSFIDFVDPADADSAIASFAGVRFWQRLELIDIYQRQMAHLPLGFYGVDTLDFEGVFADLPDPAPARGHGPDSEWHPVPLSVLASTTAGGGLLLGGLSAGQDWSFDEAVAQAGYDEWTRLAFGLAPADPVPSPHADSDYDGETNLWEYFTGTNPADPRDVSPLRISLSHTEDERYLSGSFSINPHAASSLRIDPELSFDLETWDDTPGTIEFLAEPFHPGVVLRYLKPLNSEQSAFLRATLSDGP